MANSRTLSLSELFYSIQGESSCAGYPCVFIRLSDCNLRCSYCDTSYSFTEKGSKKNIGTIIEFVDDHKNAIVEITGGEPLLQENVYPLLDVLIKKKRTILLETNGSIPIDKVPTEICTIVDVKCPASGCGNSFSLANILYIKERMKSNRSAAEIKFVICDKHDYQWAKSFIFEHELSQIAPISFSPVTSSIQPRELAELILSDHLPVRMQIQLHTLLWPETKRGV